jgi:hypothetical protein
MQLTGNYLNNFVKTSKPRRQREEMALIQLLLHAAALLTIRGIS